MTLHIENKIIFRQSPDNEAYFHPTIWLVPQSGLLVMTLQTVRGSDFYGPVLSCCSTDKGESWSSPRPIPSLGINPYDNGTVFEGVCDVVPDYHPQTGRLLAIGHNVFYLKEGFLDTLGDFQRKKQQSLQRYGVYSVGDLQGNWSERKELRFEGFEKSSSFVCGCTQKLILPDGDMIIPFTFADWGRQDRQCCTFLCGFDGEQIFAKKRGNILTHRAGRGLLEPSLAYFKGKFYLTLRAEDGHGYHADSDDGLHWSALQAWRWQDNETLTMSTTQQHWLELGGKLYLVYTRKTDDNENVIRWRSPLFMAEFDPQKKCLLKESEACVFPLRYTDADKQQAALMGNFHPCILSENEALVSVGENIPKQRQAGNTLLARIRSCH